MDQPLSCGKNFTLVLVGGKRTSLGFLYVRYCRIQNHSTKRKKIAFKQLKNKNLVAQLEGIAIITILILVSIENILTETCRLSKSSPLPLVG